MAVHPGAETGSRKFSLKPIAMPGPQGREILIMRHIGKVLKAKDLSGAVLYRCKASQGRVQDFPTNRVCRTQEHGDPPGTVGWRREVPSLAADYDEQLRLKR